MEEGRRPKRSLAVVLLAGCLVLGVPYILTRASDHPWTVGTAAWTFEQPEDLQAAMHEVVLDMEEALAEMSRNPHEMQERIQRSALAQTVASRHPEVAAALRDPAELERAMVVFQRMRHMLKQIHNEMHDPEKARAILQQMHIILQKVKEVEADPAFQALLGGSETPTPDRLPAPMPVGALAATSGLAKPSFRKAAGALPLPRASLKMADEDAPVAAEPPAEAVEPPGALASADTMQSKSIKEGSLGYNTGRNERWIPFADPFGPNGEMQPAYKLSAEEQARSKLWNRYGFDGDGVVGVIPPLGVWDPLGIMGSEQQRQWEMAEIKHGRFAMLACLHVIVVKSGARLPGFLSDGSFGGEPVQFADVPDDPLAALAFLSGPRGGGLPQLVFLLGFLENVFEQHPDRAPGDTAPEWGNWVRYTDPEERQFKLNVERSNGRLAMLGIFGMLANEMAGADPLTGGPPTPHIF
jgi:hypothetical protein